MDQKIINLFDEYTHKPLSRQEFLSRLAKLTGGMAAAMAVLPLLEVNYAKAETIAENEAGLITKDITFDGADGQVKAYLAMPDVKSKLGAVIVIHENRGLNPHIKDVARRVAKAGFLALAPDALSPFGGTPEDTEKARELIGKLDQDTNLENFKKGSDYLRKLRNSNGKTAAIGFCWGGAMVNQLAVNDPYLNAGISYYGRQPKAEDVPKIKAEMQLHYGGLDERINEGIPAFEKALQEANVKHQIFIYEGAQHAFNNDTAPTRYNETAAKLAWERTKTLLNRTIK